MNTLLTDRPQPRTAQSDLRVFVYTPQADEEDRASITLGYGACSISGCPCKGFQNTYGSDLCQNCGHKYTDHW